MAYPVERIVPVNLILQAAGLQYANFVTWRSIATADMLAVGATFGVDTFKTYDDASEVAQDFATDSPVYYQAQYWFGSTPKPGASSFQVWMWDNDAVTGDTLIQTLDKAEDQAPWRFFIGLPQSTYGADELLSLDLAAWADANRHIIPLTFSSADNTDENIDTDIPSVLQSNGARFITQKFRSPSIVAIDERQLYAPTAEMAFFQRFNFDGIRTSVDPEFKPMLNVIGEDLRGSQYTALENKRLGFYTDIELKGERVTSRTKNSWTTSAFNETVDDVFSLEVLANRAQVDGFNYISRRKRGLRSPRDYEGLIATVEQVAHQAFINGTLGGPVTIEDPRTGEDVTLKYGYLMLSQGEDVTNLTEAQISAREYPPIQLIVVLARSARVVAINLTVE